MGVFWGEVIVDLAIIGMAVYVSVWQNDTNYLWLLLLLGASGSYYSSRKD